MQQTGQPGEKHPVISFPAKRIIFRENHPATAATKEGQRVGMIAGAIAIIGISIYAFYLFPHIKGVYKESANVAILTGSLSIRVATGWYTYHFARKMIRNKDLWAALGYLFPALALLLLAFLKPRKNKFS